MGVTVKNLFRLQELNRLGYLSSGTSIIELGAQELYCAGMEQSVADFFNTFSTIKKIEAKDEFIQRVSNKGFTSELLKRAGFSYKALDIFDGDGVILFDLNLESPGPGLTGEFGLVTNFGTTEHVIHQYAAFKTVHELAKPGGLIYHDLPMAGYHTHGYFNYNPLFFQHLANSNDYEILFQWYSRSNTRTSAPDFMSHNGFGPQWTDMGIEYIFRKTTDQPFRMPLETGTSLALNPAVWKGGEPYGRQLAMPSPEKNGHRGQLANTARIRSNNSSLRLREFSGWDLQRELIRRYKARLKRFFGA
jgi:hypothetical protein